MLSIFSSFLPRSPFPVETGAGVCAELSWKGHPGFGEELPARGAGRYHGADHAAVRTDAHERVHDGLLPPPFPPSGTGKATLLPPICTRTNPFTSHMCTEACA